MTHPSDTINSSPEDIEQLFEQYEQQFTNNTKWLADEQARISSSKFAELLPRNVGASPEFSSNITLDDIVKVVGNIVAESSRQLDSAKEQTTNNEDDDLDEKKRTVVVVVSTNVYHINAEPSSALNNEQSAKQQHTLLSYGNPMLLPRDTLTSVQHSAIGLLPTVKQQNAAASDADNLNFANENPIRDYILSNGIVKPIYSESSNDGSSQ